MERFMKHLSRKLLCVLAVAVLITIAQAHAVTGAFEPGFDANGLSGSGLVGNNYFLTSIVGRGRFHVSPNNPDTMDPSVGRTSDHRELSEDSATSLYTDMTWMLGYNYYRSSGSNPTTGEGASDDAHTFRLGFALDLGDAFDMLASGSYQLIPEENYSQGILDVDLGYFISLAKETRGVKVEGDDAESFYLRKEKEQQQVIRPAKVVFPSIKVGLHFLLAQERKSPDDPNSGRVDSAKLQGDALLNVAGSGPYVTYNFSKLLSFKMAFLVYYYDTNVQQFLSYTTIGNFRPQEGLALADMDDTTLLLMTFPSRSFTGTLNFQLTSETSIRAALQEATYSISIGGAPTTSVGAILTQQINQRIKLGVQLDETAGGGGVNGNSNAVGAVGGVTLGYLF
jgi:hypothetical protein